MPVSHGEEALEIRGQLERLAEFVSPELLTALSESAQSEESWSQAGADVEAFLRERKITAPPGTELSFNRAFPGQPTLDCPDGFMTVCKVGPPVPTCLRYAWIKTWAPKIGVIELRICRFTVDMPTYSDCRCVPIEPLSR
jgi:hypothetical protein